MRDHGISGRSINQLQGIDHHVASLYALHQRLYEAQVRKKHLKTLTQQLKNELKGLIETADADHDKTKEQLQEAVSIREKVRSVW